ncbi:hypothetical protein Godav_006396 [Gossypium davidsonii]|uniref:Uncharacterized protein n=1 Tax=Gossypium davidsonii TaxID=34287 RepID=A0A7J8S3V4_GOSDV|nr:hypothetical protein [Gossypium davidsonii]
MIAHPDVKKKVDVFVLRIYGLVIFHKGLGHIDDVKVKRSHIESSLKTILR